MFCHSVVSNSLWPHGLQPARLLCPWDSPGKNTEVGCHFFLQVIFQSQGLNLCLLCLLHWQVSSLPAEPPMKLRYLYVDGQNKVKTNEECVNYVVGCPFIPTDFVFFLRYLLLFGCTGFYMQCTGSSISVAACGIFSCGIWDLVPWSGVELGPPTLGAWNLSHWTTREVPFLTCIFIYFIIYFIPIDFNMKLILFTYQHQTDFGEEASLCYVQLKNLSTFKECQVCHRINYHQCMLPLFLALY